jgi:large subunit ribosomal protein L29
MKANANEYRERSVEDLRQLVEDIKEDIFKLRFQHATGQLDDVSKLRQAKHKLARVRTIVREHELGIRVLTAKPMVAASGSAGKAGSGAKG